MIFKKYNVFYICLFIILFIIGTFYDFQISCYLFNSSSFFGRLLASYGAFPATFLIMVSSYVFLFNTKKIYLKLVGVILLVGSFYYGITNRKSIKYDWYNHFLCRLFRRDYVFCFN